MILFWPALLGMLKGLAMKTALGQGVAASQAAGGGMAGLGAGLKAGVMTAAEQGGGGGSQATVGPAPVAPVVGNVLGRGSVQQAPQQGGGMDGGRLNDFLGATGRRRGRRLPF
jgi:hypothetical protein